MTFVDEGNKEKIDGLWNFRKRVLEYDVIIQVLKYQSHNYNLHMVRNSDIQGGKAWARIALLTTVSGAWHGKDP